MKTIYAKNTKNAILVSDKDYEWASEITWHERVSTGGCVNFFGCPRKDQVRDDEEWKKNLRWVLHQRVLYLKTGVKSSKKMYADHIDRNQYNCTAENLRLVTPLMSAHNRVYPKKGLQGTSKTKNGKWDARFTFKGVRHHVGRFATELEAHEAYMSYRSKYLATFETPTVV